VATILQGIADAFRRVTRRRPLPSPPRQVPTEAHGRHLEYAPDLDGEADPGEIVWTWVRYEDDPHQGKDRPVLVVGRDGRTLLGLMLSSRHERDGQRNWLTLGPGDWDRAHRPSWIRLDRILEVDEDGIRREGAVLDRTRFDRVAARLRTDYGWH
jgi:PemK-like, MazF-like toxin of type II toxin-antitoxin system